MIFFENIKKTNSWQFILRLIYGKAPLLKWHESPLLKPDKHYIVFCLILDERMCCMLGHKEYHHHINDSKSSC